VREPDQTVTFCGRRRTPGGVGGGEVLVDVRQRVRSRRSTASRCASKTGGHELVVVGVQVSGQWRVERRLDGAFVDIQAARESLAAIDCESVTTLMLLAHTRGPGHFPVVRFYEGLQLEVVRWDLAINEQGDYGFKTPGGLKLASFQENGALRVSIEQLGATQSQTTRDGAGRARRPGLPLADEIRAKLRAAAGGVGPQGRGRQALSAAGRAQPAVRREGRGRVCSELNREVPPARPGEFAPLRVGGLSVWPPVVLRRWRA